MASISEFKSQFGGGARPTLYEVELTFPAVAGQGADVTRKLVFSAKGAQIPGVTTGLIEVPYKGRTMKIAGDRSFQEITLTIINDVDWKVRTAFERWSNVINTHAENVGLTKLFEYATDVTVKQLDRNGKTIASYILIGSWCSDLSPIELGYDQQDTIEEFTVTLQYQYWVRPDAGII